MPIPGSLLNERHIISQSASLWPDLATILDRNDTTEGTGQEITGTPTQVLGMVDIRCRLSPLIMIRPTDTEERRNEITRQHEDRQLSLFGHYPNINTQTQIVTVTSTVSGAVTETFKILGLELDGNRKTTRLKVEIMKP